MIKNFGLGGARSPRHSVTTLIAAGTIIDGDVVFSGTLEIEGVVNGVVRSGGDEHAVVRILPGGHVRGDVHAPIVVVNGLVTGNVCSDEHVELASGAVICGDVEYSLIEMTKGAQVEGRLHFRGSATNAREPRMDSAGGIGAE